MMHFPKQPNHINELANRFNLDRMGFEYRGMISSTRHRFDLNVFRVNMDVSQTKVWFSVRKGGDREHDFETLPQLLEILVTLGCVQAAQLQRVHKIDKLLT